MDQKIIKYEKQEIDVSLRGPKKLVHFYKLYNKSGKEIGIVDDQEFLRLNKILGDKSLKLANTYLAIKDSTFETEKRFSKFLLENQNSKIVFVEK